MEYSQQTDLLIMAAFILALLIVGGIDYARTQIRIKSKKPAQPTTTRFMVCQRSSWSSQQRAIQRDQKRVLHRFEQGAG